MSLKSVAHWGGCRIKTTVPALQFLGLVRDTEPHVPRRWVECSAALGLWGRSPPQWAISRPGTRWGPRQCHLLSELPPPRVPYPSHYPRTSTWISLREQTPNLCSGKCGGKSAGSHCEGLTNAYDLQARSAAALSNAGAGARTQLVLHTCRVPRTTKELSRVFHLTGLILNSHVWPVATILEAR